MNKKVFPFKPIGDIIIIDKIVIKSQMDKTAEKANLIMSPGIAPKNIQDIERKKMQEASSYNDLRDNFESMWDKHPNQGVVMAIGPGRETPDGLVSVTVKPGDKVYFRGSTGEPVLINKKMYIVIREYDIYGVDPKY